MIYRNAGYTLSESITVLALVSIFLAISIPSFSSFITRYRLTTVSNEFLSSINLTRNEALKRSRRVDMIPVNGNWNNGWVIFIDQNNNQLVNTGEEIIDRHGPMPGGIAVSKATVVQKNCNLANGIPFTNNGTTYIAYIGNGFSRLNSGAFLAGSMLFLNGSHQRCLVMNATGRIRIIGS